MLAIVTWKWRQPGYPHQFDASHVNTLARQFRRHLSLPHTFKVVTDDATGIDPEIGVVPLWGDHGDLANPSRHNGPSCYRRLRIWARDAGEWLGDRIVSVDLDTVLCGDVTPLFDRPEPVVLWGDTNPTTPYNGGLVMLSAGAAPQVWERFDPATSPQEGKRLGYFGSDQAWLGVALGTGMPTWGRADGVYSYRIHCARGLPACARLVSFHGGVKPWSQQAQRVPWIREHYH